MGSPLILHWTDLMESKYSETALIGFLPTVSLMVLGPIISIVYAAYTLAYRLLNLGWDTGWRRLVFYPYLILFMILNVTHNWLVATVLFREFPREFLTSDRLRRMKVSEDPWRRELADMLGGFLNAHDPDHY